MKNSLPKLLRHKVAVLVENVRYVGMESCLCYGC